MIRASIIVPTRDRARLLASCLESFARQTLDPASFEVIVVDNGSSDDTVTVAVSFSNRLNLRYISAPDPGLHVGRHAGMRAARSNVLMYADDDIEAEPTWVESVLGAFEDGAVLVGGNNHPRFEVKPPDWLREWWAQPVGRGRALGYLSILDFGTGSYPLDWQYVWGCNFSVSRSALEAIGGFHPDGMPRELLHMRGDGESHVAHEIHRRGGKIWFDSGASVHHLVSRERMTLQYIQRRAFAEGVTGSYMQVRRNGGCSLPLRRRVRSTLREWLAVARQGWQPGGRNESEELSLRSVKRIASDAWRLGFRFHQAALRSDNELIRWVLREHYLS